jgi:hypothetical protein
MPMVFTSSWLERTHTSMSRQRQDYHKHVIQVTSLPLRDGGFTVHVDLECHTYSYSDTTHCESGQRFRTDEEALAAGLGLGKQKIDEGYESRALVVDNWTVPSKKS